jgi:hypothetical protein
VDEAGMGYADEVLIPPPPYIHFLLPQRVLADDERAEVDALEDKRLPNFVVGRVVEVLAGGGGTVYRGKVSVGALMMGRSTKRILPLPACYPHTWLRVPCHPYQLSVSGR